MGAAEPDGQEPRERLGGMQMPTHAGWFDDPADPNQLRYYDGVIWTSHTAPRTTRPASTQPQQTYPVDPQQSYAGPVQPPQYPSAPQGPQQWQVPVSGQQPPQYQPYQAPGQPPQGQYPGAPQPGGWQSPAYGAYYAVASTPDGAPLAGYFQRVGAYLIDGIIQGVILLVLGGWLVVKAMQPFWDEFQRAVDTGDTTALNSVNPATDFNYGYLLAFALLAVVIQVAYNVIFLTRSGATPGKSALGISVRLRERPGPLSVGDALKRVAIPAGCGLLGNLPFVGLVFSLIYLLDLLWPAWDDKRQALHDKVAATNVVIGRQPRRQ
jgi:uncharacterized RDD family membrane protein YckC